MKRDAVGLVRLLLFVNIWSVSASNHILHRGVKLRGTQTLLWKNGNNYLFVLGESSPSRFLSSVARGVGGPCGQSMSK